MIRNYIVTICNKCKYFHTLSQKKVKQWQSTKNNCLPLHVTWPKPILRPQWCVRKTFSTYFVHSASGKSPLCKLIPNWRWKGMITYPNYNTIYWIASINCVITFFRFSEVRFVDGDKLFASGLPVTPAEFESLVKEQCAKTREFLKKS